MAMRVSFIYTGTDLLIYLFFHGDRSYQWQVGSLYHGSDHPRSRIYPTLTDLYVTQMYYVLLAE